MAMSPGPRPAISYACFTAMSIAISLGCRREETIKPYSGSSGRSIGQTRLNFLPVHKQAPSALKRNYYDKDKGASQVHFVTRGLPEGDVEVTDIVRWKRAGQQTLNNKSSR